MVFIIAYLSLSIVVAIYGRNCRIGFWGVLLFSVVLTPVLLFYGLMGLRPTEASLNAQKMPKKRRWATNKIEDENTESKSNSA